MDIEQPIPHVEWQAADQYMIAELEPTIADLKAKPVYSLLKRNKENLAIEKDRFFGALSRGEAYEPDLTPDFDASVVDSQEARATEARQKIREYQPKNDAEAAVKQAYHWKVNEMVGNLRIAQAAKKGDMRAFNRYNAYVYGTLDKGLFIHELVTIREHALRFASDDTKPELQQAAENVISVFDREYTNSYGGTPITFELFQEIKRRHVSYFAIAMTGVELSDVIIPDVGIPAVNKMLSNLGATSGSYHYKTEPVSGTSASVNHSAEVVKYPQDVEYTPERFIGLYAGHEVGTHVREVINAENSGFELLKKSGLDRNEKSGEGKGVLREQIPYESIEDFEKTPRSREIMMRHVSAALALGVDDTPRTFSEVFQIVAAIDYMYKIGQDGYLPHEAMPKAQSYAWGLLTGRTMKGVRGGGAAYLKDTVYAEGNHAYWRLAAEKPYLIDYWDIGKVDLTELRHIVLLQKLGILPSTVAEET